MNPLTMLLIVWAGITTVLVLLLIYRSTLTLHEEDQLFLSDSESHIKKEQEELLRKVGRLKMPVRLAGAASVLLILFIGGYALWQQLNRSAF